MAAIASSAGIPAPPGLATDLTGRQYMGPWDQLVLGGVTLPGAAKVRSSRKRKCDKKSAPGSDGGNLTDQGVTPADVDITLTLWAVDQWNAWVALSPKLAPRPSKAPLTPSGAFAEGVTPLQPVPQVLNPALQGIGLDESALQGIGLDVDGAQPNAPTAPPVTPVLTPWPVSHPALAILGIRSIYLVEVDAPELADSGLVTIKIKAVEFVKPGPKNVTSTAKANTSLTVLDQPTQPVAQPPSVTDATPLGLLPS